MGENNYFTCSVFLEDHPMLHKRRVKFSEDYLTALSFFLHQVSLDPDALCRLRLYQQAFQCNEGVEATSDVEASIKKIVTCRLAPWRKEFRYYLMCDIALILMDSEAITRLSLVLAKYLNTNQQRQMNLLLYELHGSFTSSSGFGFAKYLIAQYHHNQRFISLPEKRILVTANMSAGKSTLINALIGKSLTRTSQEACTGNMSYIYSKPFEDGRIHTNTSKMNFDASEKDLTSFSWTIKPQIASFFRTLDGNAARICIVDTPGVNAALHKEHARIAHTGILQEPYDKILYVMSANKLGTDEELSHLKWIAKHVPSEKVIFILNKLDSFNAKDDSVADSLEGVRQDLDGLGFLNPVICPISAYFSLLLKKKMHGDELDEDELDEYNMYVKKFRKEAYNLSHYYGQTQDDLPTDELILMTYKCGLYGLEQIIFGGIV